VPALVLGWSQDSAFQAFLGSVRLQRKHVQGSVQFGAVLYSSMCSGDGFAGLNALRDRRCQCSWTMTLRQRRTCSSSSTPGRRPHRSLPCSGSPRFGAVPSYPVVLPDVLCMPQTAPAQMLQVRMPIFTRKGLRASSSLLYNCILVYKESSLQPHAVAPCPEQKQEEKPETTHCLLNSELGPSLVLDRALSMSFAPVHDPR